MEKTPDKKCLCEEDLEQVCGGYTPGMESSLNKLSDGMKINASADDSEGYQISERMRPQIRALDRD